MAVVMDRHWRDRAACRSEDPDLFSPTAKTPQEVVDLALSICNRCPVIETCDAWADEHDIKHGIWGGRFREPAEAAAIRKLARAGMKDLQIAKALGYRSKATVASIRRRYEIPPAVEHSKPWSEREVGVLQELLDQNWSYAQISREIGRSHTAVRKAAEARGWQAITAKKPLRKELTAA